MQLTIILSSLLLKNDNINKKRLRRYSINRIGGLIINFKESKIDCSELIQAVT
jgi:hypothetical protein